VRVQDGEVLMTDGPYVEGKEHLGGLTESHWVRWRLGLLVSKPR
jgi:hypothetical protein